MGITPADKTRVQSSHINTKVRAGHCVLSTFERHMLLSDLQMIWIYGTCSVVHAARHMCRVSLYRALTNTHKGILCVTSALHLSERGGPRYHLSPSRLGWHLREGMWTLWRLWVTNQTSPCVWIKKKACWEPAAWGGGHLGRWKRLEEERKDTVHLSWMRLIHMSRTGWNNDFPLFTVYSKIGGKAEELHMNTRYAESLFFSLKYDF